MIEVELDLVLEAEYDPETGEYMGMVVNLNRENIDHFIEGAFRKLLDGLAENACRERYKHGLEVE